MFDKDKFGLLLLRARGKRNNKEFAEDSGISRAYISGFINKKINNAPNPDIIKRMADAAENDVTYEDLMHAAGFLGNVDVMYKDDKGKTLIIETMPPNFSKKDEKDIAKELEKVKKSILEDQDGLMFDGDPASPEALQSVLDALEFGMRQAKLINKKYIPKKYRK